jgi:membrane-associated phospholipid phosphatase
LSTLFTGQHYILDVVTGLALGIVGYYAGFWIVEKWDKKEPRTEPEQDPTPKTVSID